MRSQGLFALGSVQRPVRFSFAVAVRKATRRSAHPDPTKVPPPNKRPSLAHSGAELNAMSQRPTWFAALAVVLLLWALAGVASFAAHVMVGEKMAADQGTWDLAYHRSPPAWFVWDYGLATGAAAAGAVALLMRSRRAVMLYVVSLVAVVIQFGYVFLGTDLLTHKGAGATVPFPLFIAVMACVQIVLVRQAVKRGWVA
jgi:hypothetical protein